MTDRPIDQRFHIVLAKSYQHASPLIFKLRQQGLNAIYTYGTRYFLGRCAEKTVLILGPGYAQHPEWDEMKVEFQRLVSLGATIADPHC
ncbi:hypothetical protein ACFWYW_11970 [Nonomuraea sp. NPDC059023]|uniref:hypothetical protein n=1 Tax=unclassified Nonomuraea TaxID=2593643 RepID=UPI0036AD8C17